MQRRFGKFAFVGCLGAALQLLTLSVLTKAIHLAAVPATLIAVELAILHNFWWHKKFTWAERQPEDCLPRLLRFHLGNGFVSLAGNAFVMYLFVTMLHWPNEVSGLAAIALCSIVNFALADRWVYKRR